MTKLDQLRIEVRGLAARVSKLEARKKREPAPRPSDAAVRETRALWQKYQEVAARMYGLRSQSSGKARFAERHHLSEREFRRAFSSTDTRGLSHAARQRYDVAIREAITTLQETLKQSHGTRRDSPLSRLKPAV